MDISYRKGAYLDDTTFNSINKNYISLKDEDIKKNNIHLRKIIVEGLIPLMKKDALFKDLYQNINYSGSYFKSTKVGKPDEYDLDMAMRLPLNYRTLMVDTAHEHHGYVKIKINADSWLPKWESHSKILNDWLTAEGYLDQNKFRQWMESIMKKTYDQLTKNGKEYELCVDDELYTLKEFKKSGPAFTIIIKLKSNSPNNQEMSVDLVPCLELEDILLDSYKIVPNMARVLMVVGKPQNEATGNILWRLSFYKQEKQILSNKENGKLKPVIRMLKKFRDRLEWKQLASYYIETLCLNELAARGEDTVFLRSSNTCLFMHMLNKLRDALQLKRLPYFWYDEYNLLSKIDDIVLQNYFHRLQKIIADIEKTMNKKDNDLKTPEEKEKLEEEKKYIIAKYLLTSIELSDLKQNRVNGGNELKRLNSSSSENRITVSNTVCDSGESEVDSAKPKKLNDRFDQFCNDFKELLNLRDQLSDEQLQKIHKICADFSAPNSEVSR